MAQVFFGEINSIMGQVFFFSFFFSDIWTLRMLSREVRIAKSFER